MLITQQYLDAIHLLQELNLDMAGDFLVMAATLIHIKSRMLLPRPETAAGADSDEEDPRDVLVRRLLEHERYKAAAGLLHEREQVRAAQWQRPDTRLADITGEELEPELEVDLFSLLNAFQAVVERLKHRPRVLLPPEQVPLEVRIAQLFERLSETEACGFEQLFADVSDRRGLIVTFLALLEMIRLRLVRVFQAGSFDRFAYNGRDHPTRRTRLATRRENVADEHDDSAQGNADADAELPDGNDGQEGPKEKRLEQGRAAAEGRLERSARRAAWAGRAGRSGGRRRRSRRKSRGMADWECKTEGMKDQRRRWEGGTSGGVGDGSDTNILRASAEVKAILEALIFASPDPLTRKAIGGC